MLALQGEKTVQADMEIHRPDGGIVPIEVTGTPILAGDGSLAYASTTFTDISERKKHQAELKNLSIHDELTGLLNRRGFFTLADQQMITAGRLNIRLIMLFIDLDGLKQVNDKMGHQVGDEMIRTFGRIVGEHFRKIDIVARMGGDEFGVLATDQSLDDATIIQRLREKVGQHNAFPATRYRLDFSMGSSTYDPANPCGLEELILLADERMYDEKKSKKAARAQAGPAA
jgi:diguanylate cyclase (GGDEF)-like protein